MPTFRNITLALPVQVLQQLKRIATQRQTSVSRLVTQMLEELATREAGYSRAPDLGTNGVILTTRDALQER